MFLFALGRETTTGKLSILYTGLRGCWLTVNWPYCASKLLTFDGAWKHPRDEGRLLEMLDTYPWVQTKSPNPKIEVKECKPHNTDAGDLNPVLRELRLPDTG